MSKATIVTTRMPIAMAEAVEGYAQYLDRSKSWIIKQAVSEWLEKQKANLPAGVQVNPRPVASKSEPKTDSYNPYGSYGNNY